MVYFGVETRCVISAQVAVGHVRGCSGFGREDLLKAFGDCVVGKRVGYLL